MEWSRRLGDLSGAAARPVLARKPLIVSGRYDTARPWAFCASGANKPGHDFVRDHRGQSAGGAIRSSRACHVMGSARKVDALMAQDWMGMQSGNPAPEIKGAITKLGVDFRLMTQFTSFVAVEESIRTEGGVPRRVDVPRGDAGWSQLRRHLRRADAIAKRWPTQARHRFLGSVNMGAIGPNGAATASASNGDRSRGSGSVAVRASWSRTR